MRASLHSIGDGDDVMQLNQLEMDSAGHIRIADDVESVSAAGSSKQSSFRIQNSSGTARREQSVAPRKAVPIQSASHRANASAVQSALNPYRHTERPTSDGDGDGDGDETGSDEIKLVARRGNSAAVTGSASGERVRINPSRDITDSASDAALIADADASLSPPSSLSAPEFSGDDDGAATRAHAAFVIMGFALLVPWSAILATIDYWLLLFPNSDIIFHYSVAYQVRAFVCAFELDLSLEFERFALKQYFAP
jgi:hypothetical protein